MHSVSICFCKFFSLLYLDSHWSNLKHLRFVLNPSNVLFFCMLFFLYHFSNWILFRIGQLGFKGKNLLSLMLCSSFELVSSFIGGLFLFSISNLISLVIFCSSSQNIQDANRHIYLIWPQYILDNCLCDLLDLEFLK